ncbi:MAG: hypothetical protein M1540_10015 [Candidatus Bathyarchaeota archaeon]|nr:hypothetical protein [Candidatus Bathyarchaeota archaeon]
MLEYLVFVAAAGSFIAALVYIRAMFRGETKPNRVTWFMWSVAPFIATAAAVSNGVGWAVIPVFMSGFSPFLIFTASFFTRKAYWKLSSFDYLCGVLSGLALILWYLTNNPNVAIVFAILGDALAAVPTFIKAWRNPQTESAWPFIIGIFSPMTSFLAATTFGFSDLAFPIYLIAINLLLLFPLARRKRHLVKGW